LVSTLSKGRDEPLVRIVNESNGRIFGFALITQNLDISRLEDLIGKGVIHGLKIFPYTHPHDDWLVPAYDLAGRYGLPIFFHTGVIGLGSGTHSDFSRPVLYEDVARSYPNLDIVFAHIGWPWVDEAIGIAYMTPNIYVEVSTGPPRIYKEESMRKALEVLGEDKLIYGSDNVYPISATGFASNLIDMRIVLNSLGIDRRVEGKIMRSNAMRILHITK
jgi:predicted TIM-barrel fold metal-dependent hydrolase